MCSNVAHTAHHVSILTPCLRDHSHFPEAAFWAVQSSMCWRCALTDAVFPCSDFCISRRPWASHRLLGLRVNLLVWNELQALYAVDLPLPVGPVWGEELNWSELNCHMASTLLSSFSAISNESVMFARSLMNSVIADLSISISFREQMSRMLTRFHFASMTPRFWKNDCMGWQSKGIFEVIWVNSYNAMSFSMKRQELALTASSSFVLLLVFHDTAVEFRLSTFYEDLEGNDCEEGRLPVCSRHDVSQTFFRCSWRGYSMFVRFQIEILPSEARAESCSAPLCKAELEWPSRFWLRTERWKTIYVNLVVFDWISRDS